MVMTARFHRLALLCVVMTTLLACVTGAPGVVMTGEKSVMTDGREARLVMTTPYSKELIRLVGIETSGRKYMIVEIQK